MKIKDVVSLQTNTVNPMAEPHKLWHLYSLPSFDTGQQRENMLGADIQSNKYAVPNKCILFNKLNVRFKRIWQIDNTDIDKICSTEFLPLIIDESKLDFKYAYYLLQSDEITNYLCGQNLNTSHSHKRIDPTNFFDISISLPSLSIQRRIASVLSSLDRKIALNREINQNLAA